MIIEALALAISLIAVAVSIAAYLSTRSSSKRQLRIDAKGIAQRQIVELTSLHARARQLQSSWRSNMVARGFARSSMHEQVAMDIDRKIQEADERKRQIADQLSDIDGLGIDKLEERLVKLRSLEALCRQIFVWFEESEARLKASNEVTQKR